jgi:hypothetical protein
MPVSLKTVLSTWAALVALWAPAYLVLLEYTDLASAHSQPLQWSLVAIGAAGLASVVYAAWRDTRDPAWRAAHGLTSGLPAGGVSRTHSITSR